MTTPHRFDHYSAGLEAAVRHHPDLVGLSLMGSASEAGAPRRDEWSDHDFFAAAAPGRGSALRPDLSWLPDQEHLAMTAQENELGFVAVYDDGHVFEFAVAEVEELAGALATDATVVVDDADGSVAQMVAAAQDRARQADRFDAATDARLVLVKLLIGIGRARRGEVLTAGLFVRTWAVQHLVRTLRGRLEEPATTRRDIIDPVRRIEHDLPEHAAAIVAALEQPVEEAGRTLFALTREWLEPGWDEFPSRAADAVAARLGW